MKDHLRSISDNLHTGAQSFFKNGLGFPIKSITDLEVSVEKFLKDAYQPFFEKVISKLHISGMVSNEEIREIQDPENLAQETFRYTGMLILAVDLNETSPTRSLIAELTRAFNRSTPAIPVTILYRYNKGSRIALASCERFEYQQKHRIGERTGKTAILLDINLKKPSKSHQDLLNQLHLDLFQDNTAEIESILEHWRDRFRCSDRHLLIEIAREWREQHQAFPPIEEFGSIFGDDAIATIREKSTGESYYSFLRDMYMDQLDDLKRDVQALVQKQAQHFYRRYNLIPSSSILQTYNRYKDLFFFTESEAGEYAGDLQHFLEKSDQDDSTFLSQYAQEFQERLDKGEFESASDDSEDDEAEAPSEDLEHHIPGPFFEDIQISPYDLDSGFYDDLQLCHYSIDKIYHPFLFDFLPQHDDFTTLGSIRNLDIEKAQTFKNFRESHQALLHELQENLHNVAQKLTFIKEVQSLLDIYEKTDLDFELNDEFTPLWLIPTGTAKSKTICAYLKKQNLSLNVQNIHSLTIAKFALLKGMRSERIEAFIDLKKSLPGIIETRKALLTFDLDAKNDNRIIQRNKLTQWECITANKILSILDEVRLKVQHLTLDFEDSTLLMGVPKKFLFKSLDKKRLAIIKQKIALTVANDDSSRFVQPSEEKLSLKELDQLIHEHLCLFLNTPFLKKRDLITKNIFLARYGFTSRSWTLEELGKTKALGGKEVSRERIRQVQDKADSYFLWSLPMLSEEIIQPISGIPIESLSQSMPMLYKALHEDPKRLRQFIRFITQNQCALLEVDDKTLNNFFATTPSPIEKNQILEFLEQWLTDNDEEFEDEPDDENLMQTREQASAIFETLIHRGILKIQPDGRITPTNLGKNESMAHVYAGEPAGLLTEDAKQIGKALDCSRSEYSDRYWEQINSNNLLYLSGRMGMKSIYRHINYLPTTLKADDVIQWINTEFERNPETRIDLRTAFPRSPFARDMDYFVFRHYIREHAEEHGIKTSFEGASNSDNIKPMGASSKRLTNKDRIYKLVKDAKEGISSEEITRQFHCHSKDLTSLHLHQLVDEGLIWKVSSRLYFTETNFKKTLDSDNLKALAQIIKTLNILLDQAEQNQQILDIRLLAQKFNLKEGGNFEKSLFISVIKSKSEKEGLFIKKTLVSRSEMPYSSIIQAFSPLCDASMTESEAIEAVAQKILSSKEFLKKSCANYKRNGQATTSAS